jgi:Fe-S-cluster containining protein
MTRDDLRECLREGRDPWDGHETSGPMPFEPMRQHTYLGRDGEDKPESCYWIYSCPKLLPSGRCGIYENRPEPCVAYEPGEDPMCVHYEGPWDNYMLNYEEADDVEEGM